MCNFRYSFSFFDLNIVRPLIISVVSLFCLINLQFFQINCHSSNFFRSLAFQFHFNIFLCLFIFLLSLVCGEWEKHNLHVRVKQVKSSRKVFQITSSFSIFISIFSFAFFLGLLSVVHVFRSASFFVYIFCSSTANFMKYSNILGNDFFRSLDSLVSRNLCSTSWAMVDRCLLFVTVFLSLIFN